MDTLSTLSLVKVVLAVMVSVAMLVELERTDMVSEVSRCSWWGGGGMPTLEGWWCFSTVGWSMVETRDSRSSIRARRRLISLGSMPDEEWSDLGGEWSVGRGGDLSPECICCWCLTW
jgi:hypothetical protein